jgi:serine/threonine-protein kinase RsbW
MDRRARGRRGPDSRPRAAVLGSVTVPGEPRQVSRARWFVARTLADAGLPGVDSEAATLLTSEVVTNAVLHTDSGRPGGTVTIVVLGLPNGVLVEVIDAGSAGAPVVKADPLACGGRGLFLVQQMASHWGYLRDRGGTTVWFHLAAQPSAVVRADPPARSRESGQHGDYRRGSPRGGPQLAGNEGPRARVAIPSSAGGAP